MIYQSIVLCDIYHRRSSIVSLYLSSVSPKINKTRFFARERPIKLETKIRVFSRGRYTVLFLAKKKNVQICGGK